MPGRFFGGAIMNGAQQLFTWALELETFEPTNLFRVFLLILGGWMLVVTLFFIFSGR